MTCRTELQHNVHRQQETARINVPAFDTPVTVLALRVCNHSRLAQAFIRARISRLTSLSSAAEIRKTRTESVI